jgi:hypothetical protein
VAVAGLALVGDRHAVAPLDERLEVRREVVDRDAGHLVAVAARGALGNLQVEFVADDAGVLVEELVEVAHLHRQEVRVGPLLDGEVLPHDAACSHAWDVWRLPVRTLGFSGGSDRARSRIRRYIPGRQ